MGIITAAGIAAAERGWAPDRLMTAAIRRSCRYRLLTVRSAFQQNSVAVNGALLRQLQAAPIAEFTEEANAQHYELPQEFFGYILGPHRKYSGCEWPCGVNDLEAAEEAALETIVQRAQIAGARRILELGCGWGSLTFFMAARFREAHITAVSNSNAQKQYIEREARRRGLSNVAVIRADINTFEPETRLEGRFDRIVTVEMLEHVRNHRALFERIARWLDPAGLLFVHVFRHMRYTYKFETEGAGNWMGRYFFTGGIMPSHSLLIEGQDAMAIQATWLLDGTHYARTASAWLHNLDKNRKAVRQVLARHYGEAEADRWLNRWRMFFMACRELFGYANGTEWGVSHYLFRPASSPIANASKRAAAGIPLPYVETTRRSL